MSVQFYHPNICHTCKEINKPTKLCSNCKSLSYCSREHQKLDWKSHKALCKAITHTNEKYSAVTFNSESDWRRHRAQLMIEWETLAGRPLLAYEKQVAMFQRCCLVCLNRDKLENCSSCLSISYCSAEHKALYKLLHKREACEQLRLSMEIDVYQWLEKPFKVLKFEESDEREFCNYFSVFKNRNSIQNILEYEVFNLGATILNALRLLDITYTKTTFTLYIVGASSVEATADWEAITDLLTTFLPIPINIKYIFVGPEMWDSVNYENAEVYKDCYHSVADKIRHRPDLIVAFNCGFHEFEEDLDTWGNSIELLLKFTETPFVFTSYTKVEIERDLGFAQNYGTSLEILVAPRENEYRSFRPLRDWWDCTSPIYYLNNYICIVRGGSAVI